MTELQSGTSVTVHQDPKIVAIKDDLNETKEIMIFNIDKMLVNREELDRLVEATEYLAKNAEEFNKGSKNLRRRMWWDKYRVPAIVIGGVTISAGTIATLVWLL